MIYRPRFTITTAAADLDSGQLSAVELAATVLERIDRLEPEIGAFITVRGRDAVLAEAAASDARRRSGTAKGPLDGIPVAHKDNIATAGLRTTAGSEVLRDRVPQEDAAVVTRLRDAGTVLIGKLKNYEFAHSAIDNQHFGRTVNPHDPDRVTGGSSSGSAAALAAGFCLGATGTDTGGSIRIPASFTGVVGVKPTFGLVSRHGVVPTSWSLDTVGPMALTAPDAALLLAAMEGYDPRDPGSVRGARSSGFAPRADLAGLRVGVEHDYFGAGLSPDVREAFEATLAGMSALGAEPVEVSIPSAAAGIAAEKAIVYPEATAVHEQWLEEHFHEYGSRLRKTLLTGYFFRAVDYVRAQQVRRSLVGEVEAALSRVDVIATPATPMTAPRSCDTMADAAGASDLLHEYIRLLVLPNLTGHPAVAVPCGHDRDGLPIGFQLIGRAFDEGNVLSVAHAVERHARTNRATGLAVQATRG